ncbi:MAG: ComEA family DNA-binding protein [Clostridiales bacterium]|nr:ComEA family DNA-binding protein [Clostridiales bacterium]
MPRFMRVAMRAAAGLAALAACALLLGYIQPRESVSYRQAAPRASRTTAATPALRPGGTVNINAAGVDELDALPGIGKVIARRIVEEREQNGPFYYPEDLMNVTGIGSRMLEKLLPLICLE